MYDPNNKQDAKPEFKPTRYDHHLLEMACQYEDGGGQPVLNPHNVDDRSLFRADSVFMREKAMWRLWKRYFQDNAAKTPSE